MNDRQRGIQRKIRKLLPFVSAVMLAGAVVISVQVLPDSNEPEKPGRLNLPNLISAMQAFTYENVKSGKPLPDEITLATLLDRGHLTADDVQPFEGMDLRFLTDIHDSSKPGNILVYVPTPDDLFLCALADGSVQYFTRSGFEAHMKNSGQKIPDTISNDRNGLSQLFQSGKNHFDRR